MDQWMFGGKDVSGVMAFSGEFTSIDVAAEKGDVLVATARRADGTFTTVRFEEGCIVVAGSALDAEYDETFRKKISVVADGVGFEFEGCRYRIPINGLVMATGKGFRISGDKIEFNMAN